jgi:hypothetical protein
VDPPRTKAPVDDLLMSRATPYGAMTFLRPVAAMSATPPVWDLPCEPVGHSPASWSPGL